MSLVMREWYGIFWHFLLVFVGGVVIGMVISNDGVLTVSPETPVQYNESDSGLTQSDFTKMWCNANYGTGDGQ